MDFVELRASSRRAESLVQRPPLKRPFAHSSLRSHLRSQIDAREVIIFSVLVLMEIASVFSVRRGVEQMRVRLYSLAPLLLLCWLAADCPLLFPPTPTCLPFVTARSRGQLSRVP